MELLGTRWRAIASALLLVTTAIAGLADVPSGTSEDADPGKLVVGDLKLADDDEDPSDGVSKSFHADNLAPGDTEAAELVLVREDDVGRERAIDPKATIEIHLDEASGGLADRLLVTELTYGDDDLLPEAQEHCGTPLSLASLAACTGSGDSPLANLSDPTPGGRSFAMGILFDPASGSAAENETLGFTVDVELHADGQESAPIVENPTAAHRIESQSTQAPASPDALEACADLAPAPVEPPAGLIRAETRRLLDGAGSDPAVAEVLLASQLPSDC